MHKIFIKSILTSLIFCLLSNSIYATTYSQNDLNQAQESVAFNQKALDKYQAEIDSLKIALDINEQYLISMHRNLTALNAHYQSLQKGLAMAKANQRQMVAQAMALIVLDTCLYISTAVFGIAGTSAAAGGSAILHTALTLYVDKQIKKHVDMNAVQTHKLATYGTSVSTYFPNIEELERILNKTIKEVEQERLNQDKEGGSFNAAYDKLMQVKRKLEELIPLCDKLINHCQTTIKEIEAKNQEIKTQIAAKSEKVNFSKNVLKQELSNYHKINNSLLAQAQDQKYNQAVNKTSSVSISGKDKQEKLKNAQKKVKALFDELIQIREEAYQTLNKTLKNSPYNQIHISQKHIPTLSKQALQNLSLQSLYWQLTGLKNKLDRLQKASPLINSTESQVKAILEKYHQQIIEVLAKLNSIKQKYPNLIQALPKPARYLSQLQNNHLRILAKKEYLAKSLPILEQNLNLLSNHYQTTLRDCKSIDAEFKNQASSLTTDTTKLAKNIKTYQALAQKATKATLYTTVKNYSSRYEFDALANYLDSYRLLYQDLSLKYSSITNGYKQTNIKMNKLNAFLLSNSVEVKELNKYYSWLARSKSANNWALELQKNDLSQTPLRLPKNAAYLPNLKNLPVIPFKDYYEIKDIMLTIKKHNQKAAAQIRSIQNKLKSQQNALNLNDLLKMSDQEFAQMYASLTSDIALEIDQIIQQMNIALAQEKPKINKWFDSKKFQKFNNKHKKQVSFYNISMSEVKNLAQTTKLDAYKFFSNGKGKELTEKRDQKLGLYVKLKTILLAGQKPTTKFAYNFISKTKAPSQKILITGQTIDNGNPNYQIAYELDQQPRKYLKGSTKFKFTIPISLDTIHTLNIYTIIHKRAADYKELKFKVVDLKKLAKPVINPDITLNETITLDPSKTINLSQLEVQNNNFILEGSATAENGPITKVEYRLGSTKWQIAKQQLTPHEWKIKLPLNINNSQRFTLNLRCHDLAGLTSKILPLKFNYQRVNYQKHLSDLLKNLNTAYKNKDTATFLSYFSPDFYLGYDDLADSLDQEFNNYAISKINIQPTSVQIRGQSILARCTWSRRATNLKNNTAKSESGHLNISFIKENKLKIINWSGQALYGFSNGRFSKSGHIILKEASLKTFNTMARPGFHSGEIFIFRRHQKQSVPDIFSARGDLYLNWGTSLETTNGGIQELLGIYDLDEVSSVPVSGYKKSLNSFGSTANFVGKVFALKCQGGYAIIKIVSFPDGRRDEYWEMEFEYKFSKSRMF
jgi:hypothetical protein